MAMAERNRQVLNELLQKEGNNLCADCRSNEEVEWASCNLGIFLCKDCASIHRSLGVDISRIKSIKLDNWEDDLVKKMAESGNDVVNMKYEQHLPKYYRRPGKNDTELLRMQFIRAKYMRKEFVFPDKQSPYSTNAKTGILMKRGKNGDNYRPRQFTINSMENCIQYYNRPHIAKVPKDSIPLDEVNVVLVPEKLEKPHGFQITYPKNGNTRNIYVYCDDAQETINWYTAIRCAKLERRRLAFPDRSDEELAGDLTTDFVCEGWLEKKGPRRNDPYRRRWFTLDRRKLMYQMEKLSANPRGEVYIGHRDSGYSVGNNQKSTSPLEFQLCTEGRQFDLRADTMDDKDRWIHALLSVISTPQTPQDIKLYSAIGRR